MTSGAEKASQQGLKNLKITSDPCEEWCKSLQKAQEDPILNKKLSSGSRIPSKPIDSDFAPIPNFTPEQKEQLKDIKIPNLDSLELPTKLEIKKRKTPAHEGIDISPEKPSTPSPTSTPAPQTAPKPAPCDCTKYINV